MANANGRSKTTLTGSGIGSGAQPAATAKIVYAAPSAPLGSSLSMVPWMTLLTIASVSVNILEIGSWQKRFLDSQSTKHAPRSRSSERH